MRLAIRRILAMAGKEVRQLRRDRLTIGMVVGVPLLQILLFGYAINLDVRDLRAGVADQAGTSLSRQLVMDMQASQVIDIRHTVRTAGELESLLRDGSITVGVLVPTDFERRLADPARPAAQLLVDGSDDLRTAGVSKAGLLGNGPARYRYIQVGAFSDRAAADRLTLQLQLRMGAPVSVSEIILGDDLFYRVRVGPVDERGDLIDLHRQLQQLGYMDVRMMPE